MICESCLGRSVKRKDHVFPKDCASHATGVRSRQTDRGTKDALNVQAESADAVSLLLRSAAMSDTVCSVLRHRNMAEHARTGHVRLSTTRLLSMYAVLYLLLNLRVLRLEFTNLVSNIDFARLAQIALYHPGAAVICFHSKINNLRK